MVPALKTAPDNAKAVLKVIFISLVLDLLSFTLILPLFPHLLSFYRSRPDNQLLDGVFSYLNAFKASFHKPINSRFDVVLMGGAMGSLFSFLQAIASPIIGTLSDKYGRRTALLVSMIGNILSVVLWLFASDFNTFLASRVVGGLSEGNVQLAQSIAADISAEEGRGASMALIGGAFSIAFTFGPMLGAYFATKTLTLSNPFAMTASFSLLLLVVETIYLYIKLPETRPVQKPSEKAESKVTAGPAKKGELAYISMIHFLFLFIFSGMEFSLPFMTFDLFSYSSAQSGKMLGFIGLLASLLQGGYVRRIPPLKSVKMGLYACIASMFILARVETQKSLYLAATFLAITSACTSTGLHSLASFMAKKEDMGRVLGGFRSAGQIGRATGPFVFCSLYWWLGRTNAYYIAGTGMCIVTLLATRLRGGPLAVAAGKKTT